MNPLRSLAFVLTLLAMSIPLSAADRPVLRLWPHGLPAGSKQLDAERAKALAEKTTAERIAF